MVDLQRGEAYGFIKCDKSEDEIRKMLPKIRVSVQTLINLELTVIKGIANVEGDELLRHTVIKDLVEERKCNYAFKATMPWTSNQRVANELAGIFNQAYQSQLFSKSDDFYGTFVYRDGDQYMASD